MKGVLIVGHGSRRKETELTLESVVQMASQKLKTTLPGTLMEIAYMEFGGQDIPGGLDSLAAKGASEIAVVPYFLFDGMHIRQDIPEALEQYRAVHPGVKITMGKPLGVDERLAAILADRVRECL